MREKLHNFMIKAFSLSLAFILVFPANLFATGMDNTKNNTYKETSSVMGIKNTDETSNSDKEETDQTLLKTQKSTEETENYIIEKSAKLSKTTGQIDYKITVDAKDTINKLIATFATSKNTSLENLKIEKVTQVKKNDQEEEIKSQIQKPSRLYKDDSLKTLAVTTEKSKNPVVFHLSAKLDQDALINIDEKSPIMDLDINLSDEGSSQYQSRYALAIEKSEISTDDEISTEEILKEKEEAIHQIKGRYEKANTKLSGEKSDQITWTDYINAKDDKEFTYDLNLDQGQELKDSKITIDYYEAKDKGYILNEDFSKNIPYAKSLKLQIPLGYIAKLELTTKVKENKKEYSLNQIKIPNPIYKEENNIEAKEEENQEDDDPLPRKDDSNKEIEIREDAKENSNEKIIPIDPDTNEAVIDTPLVGEDSDQKEDDKDQEDKKTESLLSAIDLNRDSVINNLKNNGKLNPVSEIAINNISVLLNSLNDDEISYDEFISSLKSQTSDISKEDFTDIVRGLTSGLNEETYNVANIDEDKLTKEVFGSDQDKKIEAKENEESFNDSKADIKNETSIEDDKIDYDKEPNDIKSKEEKIKDEAIESFDTSLDIAKKDSKKPREDDRSFVANLSEGIKGIFGKSNLKKADRELKAALKEGKSLEEIQALLLDLEKRYDLTSKDAVKLMANNEDDIKGLIGRDADENFRPWMLMGEENTSSLANKKFTIKTRFDTSNITGPIQDYQYFKIHLDDKLIVKDPSSLKPIEYNGRTIARPTYDKGSNTITYKIEDQIRDNIHLPLNIDVDYNTEKISLDNDDTFTVINKVSGLGVTNPKALLAEKIDKNGNPAGSIIEPGRDDVIQIIDDDNDRSYSVNIDAQGNPAIENGEIKGINWNVKVNSTDNLKDLGFKLNLTTVKGSGLGEIEDVKLNGKSVESIDQLQNATGIVDSKHHSLEENTHELSYTFYTPVKTVQGAYTLDLSTILTNKNNKRGAVRLIIDDAYKSDAISAATPTRVGTNNRTTIQGEFLTNDKAEWTITDAVSSGDEKGENPNNGLPLETRTLKGNQTISSGKSVIYGIDESTGQMTVKRNEKTIKSIPEKESDPSGPQAVGNIGVYEFDTNLNDAGDGTKSKNYSLGGVSISKYKDIVVEQSWNLPDDGKMPAQIIEVRDKETGEVLALKKVNEEESKTRLITIPDVKFWDYKDDKYVGKKHVINQNLPKDVVTINGKEYKYSENANYYEEDTKIYKIKNSVVDYSQKIPATFTVIKVDSKDSNKKLAGANYSLLGANVEVSTNNNGEATFKNIAPGSYKLIETKAPAGYKLDQERKNVKITDKGDVIISGNNAIFSSDSSKTQMAEHNNAPNWPDFMNSMHYGKLDQNGNAELYVYLKPRAQQEGGSTNKDTAFNITLPGVDLRNANVSTYDVHPSYRDNIRKAMEDQNVNSKIPSLGSNVINKENQYSDTITGIANVKNPITGENSYQIKFPKSRFEGDWGFLVKVTANIGNKDSAKISYDWLVDKNPGDSNIRQIVNLNKNPDTNANPTVTIANEEFVKSEIELTKFANSFKDNDKRERLANAEFVLKDSDGNPIANKLTDKDGKVSFGKHTPGVYRLEEVNAPDGYQKSNVYFEVTVDEANQVSYKAKFKSGLGQPVLGEDYWIEKGEDTQEDSKAKVTSVNQSLDYNENTTSSWGTKQNVWEAYMFESLKYHADISLSDVSPGKRFEIQFDPNLDFTQYFSTFPEIKKGGKVIADPYFDYDTNLLTYVFNKNSMEGDTVASIDLKGIIPDKYYFQNSGTKPFKITVAPGTSGANTIRKNINADYGRYDTAFGQPSQSYYFRDIYKADDGQWYVTALAYFNPLADSIQSKTLQFNWMSTNYDKNTRIARQVGKGYKPAYDLVDVKVYRTEPNIETKTINGESVTINYNMPLSFGVRPEQDPRIYTLLNHTRINPQKPTSSSLNGVSLDYDPSKIITEGAVHTSYPLKVKMPHISVKKEGFIVEQTFKITDMKNFLGLSRIFYMNNGSTSLESAFANSVNFNQASADQTGSEIPKYHKEIVGLINKKYNPGSFKITKLNQVDKDEKLSGAVFSLTDGNDKTIYRSTDINGNVSFDKLAPGRYTLKEAKAPKDFEESDKQWDVVVFNDGNVRITESGILAGDQVYQGKDINIEVTNKPKGEEFVIYKKDAGDKALAGARFKLSKENDESFSKTSESDENGLVKFGELSDGTYIIEEIKAPTGYKKLDKKWVLVVDKNGKKVYNYLEHQNGDDNKKLDTLFKDPNTNWINVKERSQSGWGYYDNRKTAWVANNTSPYKLGTRIVAINKDENYVIQRYILNPEAENIGDSTATIHREKPQDQNMTWYEGKEAYKVYELDKEVDEYISDIRLNEYGAKELSGVKKEIDNTHYGEPARLKLTLPATNKPIVVDVKVPYKNTYGGVGTGMDWTENGTTYWKSDFYESVDIIRELGQVNLTGEEGKTNIKGSYIGENSLDVSNEPKTYGFEIKKINTDENNPKPIPGAKFKLTNKESKEEIEKSSNADGILSFDDLKPGIYELEEIKPAPGYEKSTATWTVTVTREGKTYYRIDRKDTINDRAAIEDPQTLSNVVRNSFSRRMYMATGNNSLLEMGDDLVERPLKAENGWEEIDPSITSGLENKSSHDVQTKIIEINKKDHQFKQIFLINVDSFPIRSTGFDLHRQPEDGPMNPSDIISYKIQSVGPGSSIDNIKGTPRDVRIRNNRFESHVKGGGKPNAARAMFASRINTPILVEIVTSYDPGKAFGLGMNFYDEGMGPYAGNVWGAQSYKDESLINKRDDQVTISFDGNGGQWHMNPVKVDKNSVYELPASSFVAPREKEFKGWDVNGDRKQPGDRIRVGDKDLTIRAIWGDPAPKSYIIVFSAGEGSGKMAAQSLREGSSFTLPSPTNLTPPEGKEFEGWLVGDTLRQAGDEITIDSDLTITAMWKEPSSYSVNIDPEMANGRVSAEPLSAKKGTKVKLTVSPDEGFVLDKLSVEGVEVSKISDKEFTFTMPAADVRVSATFKDSIRPEKGDIEIPDEGFALIKNKQVGLDFKIIKKDFHDRPLEGAEFNLYKADDNYNITNNGEKAPMTGVSNKDGIVKFTDKDNKAVRLNPGYYVMKEVVAPQGYKKINADWKIHVYEDESGILKAKYSGPEDTSSSFLSSDKAMDSNKDNGSSDIKDAGSGIKYASRMTYINTESKTFIQRIYVDTRNYNGDEKINVRITPEIKREEVDTPGMPPKTTKKGVKTAYRSTYKIANLNDDVDDKKLNNILRYYDLSDSGVSMLNTARWRPFDWGFDEDQLNLDKGVYYIDIEGFYDDNISKEDIGKIEMNIDFLTERYFYSVKSVGENGDEIWQKDGSYQSGAEALGGVYKEDTVDEDGKVHKKGSPTPWGEKLSLDNKYPNWIGKKVIWTDGKEHQTGKIATPEGIDDKTIGSVKTTIDISSLYSSNKKTEIPSDGMSIVNYEETYNITFSKHGRDDPNEDLKGEDVTNRRLEGGVFKLQEEVGGRYQDLPESTIASAFNGYFGFRNLSPGRYRLMEVKAPEGYKPIDGPLLYFTVETIKTNSGKIIHPETGQIVDIKSIKVKFENSEKIYNINDLSMLDKDNKKVKISNVKSTDIDIEKSKVINPETNDEVSLKDLSIVADDNHSYPINQIKIVPGSSGYISLEYDKANGVYQYVPEETTSAKDGKLVDFVTSATAKNMGKIVNEKPGKGKLNLEKIDEDNKALKGAKFKLTNIATGKAININGKNINDDADTSIAVNDDGKLTFDNLEIGNYRLEEIKSPEGHINTDQEWNFTIGGELDPFASDNINKANDLSDSITLDESNMKVLRPVGNKNTGNDLIKPNDRETLAFDNKFKVKEGTKVNPGDYFTIKLSDNINLDGLIDDKPTGLDVIKNGVGTVAKANYNKANNTVTYTFTKYASIYPLNEINNKLRAFIDIDKVKNESQESVGLGIGSDRSNYKTIKVRYDLDIDRISDDENNLNLSSKIVKYNPKTGEFTHYYYINRDKKKSGGFAFIYSPYQDVNSLKIERIKLDDNKNINTDMPESFGIDESSQNMTKKTMVSRRYVDHDEQIKVKFEEGIDETDSYIIKVSGYKATNNEPGYRGYARLVKAFDDKEDLYVEREDEIYGFTDQASSEKEVSITAINPSNTISYKKVDSEGNPLEKAIFELRKDGKVEKTFTTTESGLIEFKDLKEGKYELHETKAPEGYKILDNPVAKFTVDKLGDIYREEKAKDEAYKDTTVYVKEPGIIPNIIINKKEQEIEFKKVNPEGKALTGAEFEVWYKSKKASDYAKDNVKLYQNDNNDKLVLEAYEKAPSGYTEVKNFKTSDDGKVKLKFYDSGYYALKEVKAPKGYIKPRDYVKEFSFIDGKLKVESKNQDKDFVTEVNVDKKKSFLYTWGYVNTYNTSISMKYNTENIPITYTKGNSTLTLSGLPKASEPVGDKVLDKGISITASIIDEKGNANTKTKTYNLDKDKDYTKGYGSISIDLYELVKELEGKASDSGDIKSNKTLVLSMNSDLNLNTELDIESNIVIGDKIKEDKNFHIKTKGNAYEDHSYKFTSKGDYDLSKPIEIVNQKATYPLTGGKGVFKGFAIIGTAIMLTALLYFGIFQNEKNRKKSIK